MQCWKGITVSVTRFDPPFLCACGHVCSVQTQNHRGHSVKYFLGFFPRYCNGAGLTRDVFLYLVPLCPRCSNSGVSAQGGAAPSVLQFAPLLRAEFTRCGNNETRKRPQTSELRDGTEVPERG